jgi:alpha-1,6-mannosyltransferase
MPPDLALASSPVPREAQERSEPRRRRLRVADVALFYGARGGGIRTYLEAKAAFARRTLAFEHHLVFPGRPGSPDAPGDEFRHEQPSLRLAASNGYRIPLGGSGLQTTLRALSPDVVLLHDPFWTPRVACRAAHELGAVVIAVHHASPALNAAGIPGPQEFYRAALRRWYRRAYLEVDAVMSAVDTGPDACRTSTLPLRLGLDPAFGPWARDEVDEPGEHVLYAGRLSREKGVRELLEAAAAASDPWPLRLLGTGPAGDMLRDRARALGLAGRVTFAPFVSDRRQLAREYAKASCVVQPGPHETFGLVSFEAAACGASVVTASCTPSAELIRGSVETFEAGDAADLLRAIERARRRNPGRHAAARLVEQHGWDAALSQELADLEALVAG